MRKIRSRRHLAALSVACAVLAASPLASASAASRPAGPPSAGPRVPVLHWRACDHGFQCATARVPLDYRHPRGKLIDIAVLMHRASKATRRPQTLFIDGGGPSAQIPGFIADFPAITPDLRQRFNLVTFDPRGFGFSTSLRCFRSEAAENRLLRPVAPVPLFPVGARQTATFERTYARFGARCARAGGPLLYHDSTADEARDLNLLRQAVGSARLNYIGLSYATGLGAVYANMFPSRVGHMVLDANVNPVEWTRGGKLPAFIREPDDLAAARETRSFLALCGQQPTAACAFSAGSPAATHAKFVTLWRRLRRHAVTADGVRWTYAQLFAFVPPVNVVDWQPDGAILQKIWVATEHSSRARPRLATRPGGPSVARDATPADHATPYTGLEQSYGVLCADTRDPHGFADYVAAARLARARSGAFGLEQVWTEAPCAAWPRGASQDDYAGPWNRRTASPILVIGNTGDPVAAYQNSVAMAHELRRARLLTVDGFGHTEFFNPSACATSHEIRYLLTGQLPPAGTVCQQTVRPFPPPNS
jgi:pimeloyl-ACP methyl ester carboxylesterase